MPYYNARQAKVVPEQARGSGMNFRRQRIAEPCTMPLFRHVFPHTGPIDVKHQSPGGIIHTYQKYDPKSFPSPTQPPPDVVSPAFEHMLMYGNMRRLTDEELAPRDSHRSEPNRRAWAQHRRPDGDAAGAEAEDPGEVRNRDGASGQPGKAYRQVGRDSCGPPENCGRVSSRPSKRSRSTTWNGCGTPPATIGRRSPAVWCS